MPEPARRSRYPRTVAEILDDNMRFRRATIQAVLRFKRRRPWNGTESRRKGKLRGLHRALRQIYGKRTGLGFGVLDGGSSGSSSYDRLNDVIILRGRLSVITYLHEWDHALGKGERGACRWSVNLFKRCFPEQFARCQADGHMLLRQPEGQGRQPIGDG
jgi:hypothetical protein